MQAFWVQSILGSGRKNHVQSPKFSNRFRSDQFFLGLSTEVPSLLGLAGYYQRFVEDFSKIAMPLTNLTRKAVKYEWTEICEQAFKELKKRLTSTPT